ncbi:hypothetical protein LshimejAT787_1901050 [Lyophyllum shimeji]|uniref:Uncharacterized protein n=1 Tax=Lyophyllum shimeji TaxID=47721 RepID=A0A9P3UUD1_LYOSH|nr:hypothetical protein LshimejAT787_1901050 [Lyophyllum shimeji]
MGDRQKEGGARELLTIIHQSSGSGQTQYGSSLVLKTHWTARMCSKSVASFLAASVAFDATTMRLEHRMRRQTEHEQWLEALLCQP